MRTNLKLPSLFLICSFTLITACNNNSEQQSDSTNVDSTNIVANPDSMPVVSPPNNDTTTVLKTQPTNDSNVIKPD